MQRETEQEQWRIWAHPPEVVCVWKEMLPSGSVAIETSQTLGAFGEVVAATPSRERAEQIVFAVNAFGPMVRALEKLDAGISESAARLSSRASVTELLGTMQTWLVDSALLLELLSALRVAKGEE